MRKSGQLDDPSPAQRNGLKIRGNPEIRRRRGISVLSTGQPGNAWLAKLEGAGVEETRNPITKLNGTMHDPMSYKIITENARGRKVSGVFVCCAERMRTRPPITFSWRPLRDPEGH
jgi:hypothetical protein